MLNLLCRLVWRMCVIWDRCLLLMVLVILCSGRWVVVRVMCRL